eukprot:TRINITY_DN2097_c0_g1_i2.p1 TRINITY_DN2097_c0_g1~~TRINITY_DN2097_c0_g1_i2.p1  ORF type:complete len:502 (+),score=91.82 TRINITY_DN2097_c0_g1_i2:3-1508(+)
MLRSLVGSEMCIRDREYIDLTSEAAVSETENVLKILEDSPEFKGKEAEQASFKQEMKGFRMLFNRFITTRTQKLDWSKIKPPSGDTIIPFDKLPKVDKEHIKKLASKLCILKLNGGLGTTMGCVGPKSVIEVTDGQNFLDLTIKQIKFLNKEYECQVPLILMNSFNTHEDTLNVVQKYKFNKVDVLTFNQSRYPRVWKETLAPVTQSPSSRLDDWYPPGHGDLYASISNSGILQKLIDQGKEYLFVSNVDNLGATVDWQILAHMEQSGAEYIMEVTDKTRSDVKGGTLIEYEGKVKLLEIAQVPASKVEEFKSIKKFKIFNTNNMWVSLSAIKRVVENNELSEMAVIRNDKSLDGKPIIQLETAAGAAIEFFKKSHGINVPRSRFLPVKSTSDLFLIQSDLYEVKNGCLIMNPKRPFPGPPVIKLGNEFRKVNDYNNRINGIPNIIELDQLTIAGDVVIGTDVTLKGTVIVVANHGSHIDIPPGSILENKVVTGNLRILDH